MKLQPQDIASAVGVQSQTFVVVDDEDYFYPDLFSGMIVDEDTDHGVDLAIYTGSSKSFHYRYRIGIDTESLHIGNQLLACSNLICSDWYAA